MPQRSRSRDCPIEIAGATQVPQNADIEKSGLPGAIEARQLAIIETAAGGNGLLTNPRPPINIPTPDKTRPADQPGGPLD